MKLFELIPHYLKWHYTRAIAELVEVWGNYLWCTTNYFSIKVLIKSFFKPFKKVKETTKTDEQKEAGIVTFMMSIFGIIIRLVIITAGIFSWILILIFGFLVFLVWLVLPFIMLFIFFSGLAGVLRGGN